MSIRSKRAGGLLRMLAVATLLCSGVMAYRHMQAGATSIRAPSTARAMHPISVAPSSTQASAAKMRQLAEEFTAQLGAYQRAPAMLTGTFLLHFRTGTAKAQVVHDTGGRDSSPRTIHVTNATVAPTMRAQSPAAAAAAIDALLRKLAHDHRFSGTVLVALNSTVLLTQAYGPSDLKLGIANTSATEFRIASISKQFAAAAILQLQEAGKLSIGDHLCKYVRACPNTWASITLKMLLTHTSGLPTNGSVPGYIPDLTKPITIERGIEIVKRIPLDRLPGSTFEYSNANFDLLGYVVEQVSGLPYATYMQQNVFNPLQLWQTGFDSNVPDPHTQATGYNAWGVTAPFIDVSWYGAAAGLYSTVGDLWQWDQGIQSNALLNSADTTDMFAAHVPMCAKTCGSYDSLNYGYGWARGVLGGQPILWTSGEVSGFESMNELLPKQGITIVLLSNLESSGAHAGLGVQLANMMLGRA